VKLNDLAIGDVIFINLTGETVGKPSLGADIWVGAEAQHMATDQQRQKHEAWLKTAPTASAK